MKYAKAIAAAVGAVVTVLTVVLADDVLSVDETGTLIAVTFEQILTLLIVFGLRNRGYVWRPADYDREFQTKAYRSGNATG